MSNPPRLAEVRSDLLETLAAEVTPQTNAKGKPTDNGEPFDIAGFIQRHALDVSESEPWNGQQGSGRRWIFNTSPMCEHHDGAAFILQHAGGAVTAQCHHNSCSWKWKDLRARFEPKRSPAKTPPAEPTSLKATSLELPVVFLPGGSISTTDSAKRFGRLLSGTGRHYVRGGAPVLLEQDDNGPRLAVLRPAALASELEYVAKLRRMTKDGPADAICSESTAKLLLCATALQSELPLIRVLTKCPVLVPHDGHLKQIIGYDAATGILAGGERAEDIDSAEARRLLNELIADFDFASESDRSRALAALITPALVLAGLLPGRPPLDLGEADNSQSGKGYRNKLTAALYRQNVVAVTQRRDGVGGLEESFNGALIRGANFIAIDNVRGKIDSPALESFLTEDTYMARIPYQADVQIDPRRHVVMLTSNKADITSDLANRSSCVRILKKRPGYRFAAYPEGDILAHLQAQQPRYLGAVFAIVRAWYDAGCPRTTETRHDFRPWAQTLDWIVQNHMDAAPLLDGHREAQERMTTPALNWLRDVALAVMQAGQTDTWLRAHSLLDILINAGVEIPGVPENANLEDSKDREAALRGIGRRLGQCFRGESHDITVDNVKVSRQDGTDLEGRSRREHCFSKVNSGDSPKSPEDAPKSTPHQFCGFPHSPHHSASLAYARARDVPAMEPCGDCGATSGTVIPPADGEVAEWTL